MIEAVIFDMDGVLIDSEPMHFKVDMEVLQLFNIKVKSSDLNKYVGTTNENMWKELKREYNIKYSVDELINIQVNKKIKEIRDGDYRPIKGIEQLLKRLDDKKIKMAVASSSPKVFIVEVLNKINIKEYFQEVVSGEEVNKGKPSPDVFLEAAKRLGVKAEECVVIEDSKNGVIAAKNAKMKCIGFRNLNSGVQDLSQADIVVESIENIEVDNII